MIAAAALLCGCKKDPSSQDTGLPLSANFTITPEAVYVGEAVSLDAEVTGGTTPYSYKWTIGTTEQSQERAQLTYTFTENGSFIITLNVTDAKGATAQKKKVVVVNAPKIDEQGALTVNWVGKMNGYNSKSAVAVADDGSVYSTCRDNKLYKWSSTGQSVWVKDIFTAKNGGVNVGTPSIDSDGTIFIGAGHKNADGTLKAFKADGSVKWTFTEWYRSDGTTPEPSCQGVIVGISGNNVYFGCTGQNGIVLSANKATGKRNSFCSPAGGARSGMVISKAGYVHWFGGKYGVFGISQTSLDAAGGNDPLNSQWRGFTDKVSPNTYEGQIGVMNVNGVPCVIGMYTDETGTKVYAVKATDGTVVSEVYIEDTDAQDQGGVVADLNGNIVASLNYTLGKDNGGIVIVNPATSTVVARFRTQEKVSGSPAIDKAGNIHFGTESGYYYVVKLEGSECKLLVKRNLATLVKDSVSGFEDLITAKIWCSPVIGDDGKMYICFTDNDTRAFGGVACLSYDGCKGPGASDWPMIGGNRRHTGEQK